jgi:hypothetical protein
VAGVRRVEGSSENAYAHYYSRTCPDPSATNL